MSVTLYLDTNVLCRPFDDQRQRRIREETEAFEKILAKLIARTAELVTSEILFYEATHVVGEGKQRRVAEFLALGTVYHELSEGTRRTAREIIRAHTLRPRDALHVAAALLEGAQYFLTCDDGIASKFRRRPLSVRLEEREISIGVLNPKEFVERMRWER